MGFTAFCVEHVCRKFYCRKVMRSPVMFYDSAKVVQLIVLFLLIHCSIFICGQSLINDEQISSAPILVLGNKIDIAGAASEDEIRHLFGLHSLTTGKVCSHLVLIKDYSVLSMELSDCLCCMTKLIKAKFS